MFEIAIYYYSSAIHWGMQSYLSFYLVAAFRSSPKKWMGFVQSTSNTWIICTLKRPKQHLLKYSNVFSNISQCLATLKAAVSFPELVDSYCHTIFTTVHILSPSSSPHFVLFVSLLWSVITWFLTMSPSPHVSFLAAIDSPPFHLCNSA